MRISIEKNDPGYVGDPWRYRVFIDDVPVLAAITADDEAGYVRAYARDGLEWKTYDGELIVETLYGSVEIQRSEK